MGIGFAVPSGMARSVLEQLMKSGKVVRGWLGVSIQDLSPELAQQFGITETKGVLVSEVLDGSPAKRAGLDRGDVILEYDRKPVESPSQLRNAVARTGVGKKVTIKYVRDKRMKTVDIAIDEQPKSIAKAGGEEPEEPAAPAGLLSDIEVRDMTSEVARRLGLSNAERGVVVIQVRAGSAAEEAGLKEGDLVLELNRRPVADLRSYENAASHVTKDQPILLLIKRQGRTLYITLKS